MEVESCPVVKTPLSAFLVGSKGVQSTTFGSSMTAGTAGNMPKGTRVTAMILTNPHNPLGDIYSATEMKEFLEFAKRYRLHVIVDEVYMLSVFGDVNSFQSVLSFDKLPDPQRTHVMWGISKDFAASGIRVGTLYTENTDVISALGQSSYFHGIPGPTQHMVAQLLRDRDWINQVFLPTNRARLKTAHKCMTNELTAMGIPFLNRHAGLYIWADFRKYLKNPTFEEEEKLWKRFLNNKILLISGKTFGCCEPGWFRIIFADKTKRLQLGYMDPNISGTSFGMHTSGPAFSALHRLRRKRKPPRVKDPLDDILLKFLTAQRVVEERFLQMEERRMQRDMELEDRRMQLEQRRMELEREHEYRMFTIFAQMVNALRHGGSMQTLGLDLSQAFSQSSDQATETGGARSSASVSKDGSSGLVQHQSKSLSNGLKDVVSEAELNPTFQQPETSIYLSKRGNELHNFCETIQEGYVVYHADKYDEAKNPKGIINLGTSENKLCFDLLSKRAMQTDVFQIDPPLLQYPDWKGHKFLRVEVARFLTYYCKASTLLKPDNILVVNGCGSLFSSLSAVLCDPGDRILLPAPYYGGIKSDIFFYSSVKPLLVHLESKVTDGDTHPFQLTVGKLEKSMQIAQLQGTRVTAMILTNPHNPLGDIYSATEMKEFLEFAKRYKLHVIVDEVYMLSVFGDMSSFQSVLSFDKLPDPQRTHVMWGISKDFAASGIRVGTLYSENTDVISALGQLMYFHGVPGPTQYMVAQLLRDRDWINQVFLPTNRARLKTAHKCMTNELTAMGIPFLNRHAGLYIWADFRKYLKNPTFEEEEKLWKRFLNNKILLISGKSFGCCEPGWFRIIFADKTKRLQLGMHRLRKVLEEQHSEIQSVEKGPNSDSEKRTKTAEDVIEIGVQPSPPDPALDGLIECLRQQIRTTDWLQRNTAEQFAQENSKVYDVFCKLAEK